MIKKTIKYFDFNDNERTEDFYFHLSEAELTEMSHSEEGGLQNKLNKIILENDQRLILQYFKDIVLAAYGVRSPDGKHFIKNQEVRDAFTYTAAYSKIFMELIEDEEAAIAFVNGIIPKRAKVDTVPTVSE